MEVSHDDSDGELDKFQLKTALERSLCEGDESESDVYLKESVSSSIPNRFENTHRNVVDDNFAYSYSYSYSYSVVNNNLIQVKSQKSRSNYKYKRRSQRQRGNCDDRGRGGVTRTRTQSENFNIRKSGLCNLTKNNNNKFFNCVNSVSYNLISIISLLQYLTKSLQYVRGLKMLKFCPHNILLLIAIVMTFGLLHSTEAGVCWTRRMENGKCKDMYMDSISKEECCKRGQEFGYTEQELSPVEIFFASAIDDGAKCMPCLDSCQAAKCGPEKRCAVRKGKPKCICDPPCRGSKNRKLTNKPIQVIDMKRNKNSNDNNPMLNFGFFSNKKYSSISSSNIHDNLNVNNKRKRNTEPSSGFLQTTASVLTTTEKLSEKKRNQRIINSNNNDNINNNNNNNNNLKLTKRLRQQLNLTTVSSSSDSEEKIIPFTSLDKTQILSSSTGSIISTTSSSLSTASLSSSSSLSSNLVKNNKLLITAEGISPNNLGKLGNSFKRNKKNSNITSKTIVIVQSNNSPTTFNYDSDDTNSNNNGNSNSDSNNNNNNNYNNNNKNSTNNIRNIHQNDNQDHRNRHQYNKKKKKKKQRKFRDHQKMNSRNVTMSLSSSGGVSPPRRQQNHRHQQQQQKHQRQHNNNEEQHQLHHNNNMQIHHQNELQQMQNRHDPGRMMTLDEKIRNGFFDHGFPYPSADLSLMAQDPYYNPVCGTDGKTYKTECQLKKRACRQDRPSLIVAYRGHCQTSCDLVRCINDLTCVEDQYGIPHCISCSITCPEDELFSSLVIDPARAVCGADGRTYKSVCDINRVVCRTGRSIPVAYDGPCRDAPNCNNVRCGERKICLTDLVTHQPRCVSCNFKCPRKRRPQGQRYEDGKLCGTNNHTYNSWCQLRRDSCNTGFYIDIRHNGPCHKDSFSLTGMTLHGGFL